MSVEFGYLTKVELDESKISAWIESVIEEYGYIVGEIYVRFVSDEYLLELNKSSLDHDYYTDIITFDYVADELISGDLFISVDRVKENATDLGLPFYAELTRVIIHGILHLIGYGDETEEEEIEMRTEEDYCLEILKKQ